MKCNPIINGLIRNNSDIERGEDGNNKAIAIRLKEHNDPLHPEVHYERGDNGNTVVKEEVLLEAMPLCNNEKGIGSNGFDGRILESNHELRIKVAQDIAGLLNELPAYLNEGRYVPIS